ncbi:MAG: hypothetical protein ACFFD7_04540, partial [Candidatus Thorarchaeota archaeon]
MLGCGILLKPTLLLLLPFIIIINFNKKTRKFQIKIKQALLRLVSPLTLVLISAFFFIIYPNMLNDFIYVNLAGR